MLITIEASHYSAMWISVCYKFLSIHKPPKVFIQKTSPSLINGSSQKTPRVAFSKKKKQALTSKQQRVAYWKSLNKKKYVNNAILLP